MKRNLLKIIYILTFITIIFTSVVSANSTISNVDYNYSFDDYFYGEEEETPGEDGLTSAERNYEKNSSYVIDNYDVKMNVTEDNIFEITETIDVDFRTKKHGIFRKLPLKNTVRRVDKTSSVNKAKVSNVKVNAKYTKSKENGYVVIKIGDANKYLTGKQRYVISYTYNIGNDPLTDEDELYYNLVGTEWDTQIKRVTFTVTMPKAIDKDENDVGFSTGRFGTVGTSDINLKVEGNVISGEYNHVLNYYEGLTARATMPEGYFVKQKLKLNILDLLAFAAPVVGIIYLLSIWFKYGRDDAIVETVEFYPPDGLNSLDLAVAYKNGANNKDAVSLLICLANQGYVKIIESKKDGILGTKKDTFTIEKIKEYDGKDPELEIFMSGLFKGNKQKVEKEDLVDSFYTTINTLISKSSSIKKKMYEQKNNKYKWIGIGYLILTYFCSCFRFLLDSELTEDNGFMVIVFGPVIALLIIGLIIGTPSRLKMNYKSAILYIFGGGIILAPIMSAMDALNIDLVQDLFKVEATIGLIGIIIMLIIIRFIPKRSHYGTELMGKIRGFKNFLETAEKDRIETLVEEDPQYFYNILPYAYVLGVSDKWINKFESITMEPPTWYTGTDVYTMHSMTHFMNTTMTSVTGVMSSSPASSGSSSGGFSSGGGGGFSGGGSGGGGGGSW